MQFLITFIIAYVSGIVVALFFIDNYREYRLIRASKIVTRVTNYASLQQCMENIASGKSNSIDIHPSNGQENIIVRLMVTEVPPLPTADSTEGIAQEK